MCAFAHIFFKNLSILFGLRNAHGLTASSAHITTYVFARIVIFESASDTDMHTRDQLTLTRKHADIQIIAYKCLRVCACPCVWPLNVKIVGGARALRKHAAFRLPCLPRRRRVCSLVPGLLCMHRLFAGNREKREERWSWTRGKDHRLIEKRWSWRRGLKGESWTRGKGQGRALELDERAGNGRNPGAGGEGKRRGLRRGGAAPCAPGQSAAAGSLRAR